MIGEIKFHAYTHVYIYILYFRTKFLLILEIQYFSLFLLFQLHLPHPEGNITFEIPVHELYYP